MWLAEKVSVAADMPLPPLFLRGRVTISGERLSVDADGELRDVEVLSPAGMRWRPKNGGEVLVVKTEDGAAAIAAAPDTAADELSFTVGDAAVKLARGGVTIARKAATVALDDGGIKLTVGGAVVALDDGGIRMSCGSQFINITDSGITSTLKP